MSFPATESRDWLDIAGFSYNMMFFFMWELTKVNPDESAMFKCDHRLNHALADFKDVQLIYTDFPKWQKRERFWNNIKPAIFAHVEVLEELYPVSLSCSRINEELYTYFVGYNTVLAGGDNFNLISMNFFSNMGTVLSHVV